jgi:hypothetical protein
VQSTFSSVLASISPLSPAAGAGGGGATQALKTSRTLSTKLMRTIVRREFFIDTLLTGLDFGCDDV